MQQDEQDMRAYEMQQGLLMENPGQAGSQVRMDQFLSAGRQQQERPSPVQIDVDGSQAVLEAILAELRSISQSMRSM